MAVICPCWICRSNFPEGEVPASEITGFDILAAVAMFGKGKCLPDGSRLSIVYDLLIHGS